MHNPAGDIAAAVALILGDFVWLFDILALNT